MSSTPATHAPVPFALLAVLGLGALACTSQGPGGVAECDGYFGAVDRCASAPAKEALKGEAEQNRLAWQQLDREAVRTACIARASEVADRCNAGPEGVAACDAYLKAMQGCKNETQRSNLAQNLELWKARPKSQLEQPCAMALELAKEFCK